MNQNKLSIASILEALNTLDYAEDRRESPNERRLGQFRVGWKEGVQSEIVYAEGTLRRLTWRNLGYRLGRLFGEELDIEMDGVYFLLAGLYELNEDGSSYSGNRDTGAWQPRTAEDRLIHGYWQSCGGRVYLEVPVGGAETSGIWGRGHQVRRIDAIRMASAEDRAAIMCKSGYPTEFQNDLSGTTLVELIEAKRFLNRPVIGQVIAGATMFTAQYGVKTVPVILCFDTDTALSWVCEKHGIRVVIPPTGDHEASE